MSIYFRVTCFLACLCFWAYPQDYLTVSTTRSYSTDGVYTAGSSFDVTITVDSVLTAPVKPVLVYEAVPANWAFDEVTDAPVQSFDLSPTVESGFLVFGWSSLDSFPQTFTYRLTVPPGDTGIYAIDGVVGWGVGDGNVVGGRPTAVASGYSEILYPSLLASYPATVFATDPTNCGSINETTSHFELQIVTAVPLVFHYAPVITHDVSAANDMQFAETGESPIHVGGATSPTSGYYEFSDIEAFGSEFLPNKVLLITDGSCVIGVAPNFPPEAPEPCSLIDVSSMSSIDSALDTTLRDFLSMGSMDDYDPCALETLDTFTHDGTLDPIYDLAGLEFCANLHTFTSIEDQFTDLGPIAQTKSPFSGIYVLSNPALSDISALHDYAWNGAYLNLTGCNVADISPLAGRLALQQLNLSQNPIEDLTPLENLTFLGVLNFVDTAVESLDGIESLSNVVQLFIEENDIDDLTQVGDLVNLREIFLGNRSANKLLETEDLEPLTLNPNLSYVSITDTNIDSIRPLLSADNLGDGDTLAISGSPLSEECQCEERALMAARGVNVDDWVSSGPTYTCGDEEAFLPRAGSLLHIPVDNGVIEGHDVGPIMSVAYDDAGNVGLAFTDYAMLHVYYIEYGPNGTGGPIELDDPIIETGIDPLSEVLETVRGIYSLDLKFGPSGQAGIAVGVHPEFDDKAVVFYLRTNASNANWTGPETVVDADAPPGADAVDNSFKFSFAAFDFLPTGEPLVAFTTKWGEAGDFGFAVRSSGIPHWTPNFNEDFFGGNEEGGSNATLGDLVYARGNVTLNLFQHNGQTEWLAFVGTQREDGLDLIDEIQAVRGNATSFLGSSVAFTTDGGEAYDSLLDDNVGISEIKCFSATVTRKPVGASEDLVFGLNIPFLAISAYDNSLYQRDGIYVKEFANGTTTVAFKQYRSSDVIQLGGMVTTKEQDALLTFVTYPDSPSGDWEGSVYTLDALNLTHDAIDEDFHEVLVDNFFPPSDAWDNDEWRPAIAYSPDTHLAAVAVKGHMPGVPTSDSVTHQTAIVELPATGVANFGPHVRFANSFGWLPNSWDTSGTWAQGGSGSAHYEHNSTNGATLGRTVSHGDFRLRFRLKLETGSTEAHVLVRADDQTSPTDYVQFTFSTDGAEIVDSDSVDLADNTATTTYIANLWYQCEIVGSGGSIRAYVGADGSPLALVTPMTSGSPPVDETTAITSGTDIAFTAPGSNQIQVDDVILWVY